MKEEKDEEFDYIGGCTLDDKTKRELKKVTDDFFERPIEKAENFDWEEFKRNETFKAIMMPSELFWILANFERSFTQKLGEQMYEKFAKAVANANDDIGDAETQYELIGKRLTNEQENIIEDIISGLDNRDRDPDWEKEKKEVKEVSLDKPTKSTGKITWDLWIKDFSNGRPLAVEIKTPKPNKDQSMESKRQMLKTVAVYEHEDEPCPIVRFVFPFNPYGDLADYGHWPPQSIFNVTEGDGMLVGKEFWDSIGGEGTREGLYNFLLEESGDNIEKLERLAGDSEL
ncbi:TdeIII family type II restriction endonuclease [Haladaptatus sp. F3-133]|jgi:hypothetical protein|uniref:type II site-specific deoxyribonuclease n=1 Tax=Halorutilus salinus TaxID=2487751 RepID=A0A9Q4C610_9EURY|nr:TdeIII family type II restriction endonuclease [Halorutilus salinus]MCX2819737.1 TdeIII family type II restriction endonuclease [Halorutilus salinus]